MTDERQKKTTDEYRANWDSIFKPQPKQPTTEVLLEVEAEKDNQQATVTLKIPF
jgi:hypothetical protein